MVDTVLAMAKDAPMESVSGFRIHKIVGGKGWNYREHSHQGYCELVCATEGAFRHVINGRESVQGAGEIRLIREADVHELSGRRFSYVNVMFDASWLARLERFVEFPGMAEALLTAESVPSATVPPHEREAFKQALDQLLSNSSNLHGRRFFARFLLTAVTYYLAPIRDQAFPSALPDWLRDLLVWLAENRDRQPRLDELVRRSCRCHEHLTRAFSRHVGVTPSRYLADLKIERAAEMLVTTNQKLLEICHATGFENESYFFRLFRKRKGMSPLAYRRAFGTRSIQQ